MVRTAGFFFLLLVFTSVQSTAQIERDSLVLSIQALPDSEEKVKRFHDLAWQFRRSEPVFSKLLLEKAEPIAKKLNNAALLAENYNFQGVVLRNQGRFAESINFFFQALQLTESSNPTGLIRQQYGYSLNNIGDIYQRIDDIENAIIYSNKAIRVFKELHDSAGLAYAYLRLGELYENEHKYDLALSSFQNVLALRKTKGSNEQIATTMARIARTYLQLRLPENAYPLIQEALKIKPIPPHIDVYLKASEAEVLFQNGLSEKALNLADSVLQSARKIGLKEYERDLHYTLFRAYQKIGNDKKALVHHLDYTSLKDSLGNVLTTGKIADSRMNFELNKKNSEIKILELQAERQIFVNILTSLVFLIIVGFMFEVVRRNRSRTRINQKLNEQNSTILIQNQEIIKQKEFLMAQAERLESALRKKNEAFDQLSVMIQEITLQKDRVEEQRKIAESANSFKTELLGIAAHDLKNPLTIIKGYTELLLEKENLNAEESDMLFRIKESCERMMRLINDLLGTASIDSGNLKLNFLSTNITALTEFVIEQNLTLAQRKTQKILFQPEGNFFVWADSERLKTVIDNLLSNAVKYSPKGKTIEVSLLKKETKEILHYLNPNERWEAASGNVLLAVKDEGPGFSEEDQKKLFKRFQRLAVRPTGGEYSTGLGLSIAKDLVSAMNGKIWAESAGSGKGSCFYILFPLHQIE
ncbi:MAG: tetratricopeptide repeat-containing sensor histidine kinase [Chloroherpetonaceae bacterium]|nr:tetratricopeptide repeat-containing sensor histidine kinase [Chloroherpetonaceae bacterium]